jgi:hypothetical protein
MTEQVFLDVFGDEVVMTHTVRAKTLEKHPEAATFIDLIAQVLQTPDQIRRSNRDERGVLYYLHKQDIFGGKWIVVVVKRIDRNFVSTVYVTSKIKSGEVLWTK